MDQPEKMVSRPPLASYLDQTFGHHTFQPYSPPAQVVAAMQLLSCESTRCDVTPEMADATLYARRVLRNYFGFYASALTADGKPVPPDAGDKPAVVG